MLSPLELLDFAQNLAARIPLTPEYSEEKNAAWLAIGTARLRFDDISNEQMALGSIDDLRVQAPLRVETAKWAGEHQDSEIGRNILRETASQFSSFECWLTRKDITDLVPSVFKLLGIEAVCSIARQLEEPFSPEQVEQGLWFVFGYPFRLQDMVGDRRVSLELREECLRSMINPFRDYYLPREDRFSGSGFFMWWDSLLDCRGEENSSEIETICIDVLRLILQLPGKQCQFAALHGLNHMHPNPASAAMVREYLEEHSTSFTADEITWVEACAIGDAV